MGVEFNLGQIRALEKVIWNLEEGEVKGEKLCWSSPTP